MIVWDLDIFEFAHCCNLLLNRAFMGNFKLQEYIECTYVTIKLYQNPN